MRFRLFSASSLALAGLLTVVSPHDGFGQSASTLVFTTPHVYGLAGRANASPRAYAAGDLDEDGNTDMVVNDGSTGGANLQILFGDGQGNFNATSFPNGPSHADSILIADVNGDHHLDVITLNGSYDSSFGGPCCSYNGELGVYLGDGKGGFTLSSSQALPIGFAAGIVGDFTGDGKPDLAVLVQSYVPQHSPSMVEIFVNHGDGSFTQGQTLGIPAMIAITAGDFNGDGKLDLAVAGDLQTSYCDQHGAVRTFYGNGDGTFPRISTYWLDSCPTSLASADFNGDGKTDLLVGLQARHAATARPRIATLLAKRGGYYWSSAISVPLAPYSLALSDLDGNGKLDLATSWSGSGNVHTFLNQGNGRFAQHQVFGAGVNSVGALLAAPISTGSLPSLFYGSSGPFLYALLNGGHGGVKVPLVTVR